MEHLETEFCVVGAGYAGLAAARSLAKAGRTVAVLEARDRVGGRVWTQHFSDGTPADFGGTWIGPGHDRVYALAREFDIGTYPTFVDGENVIMKEGKAHRYEGLIPSVDPLAIASFYLAVKRLDWMARSVPPDAPWKARRAREWDATTIAAWLDASTTLLTPMAKKMLRTSLTEIYCSDLAEVPLLNLLFEISTWSGTLEYASTIEGGAQQDLLTGGAQTMANRIATELDDAVFLESPVQRITQTNGTVEVVSDRRTVKARRVIVTVPPPVQARIEYDPPLPSDRAQLIQRMPIGAVVRAVIEWDEPFWRADGLTGETVDFDSPIAASLDASPPDGERGVLSTYAFGPAGRQVGRLAPEERRRLFLDALTARLGPKTATPAEYREYTWHGDPWSGGAIKAHFPPGVLTTLGHALRRPVGRIHWAGTETAPRWFGFIEGAIRSGERAAEEVSLSRRG
jgi:monoamine oxidase